MTETGALQELEVYITPDGLGRGAIVRRPDGLLCVYTHWRWSVATQKLFNVLEPKHEIWTADNTSIDKLYAQSKPQSGLFRNIEEARRELRALPGFCDAASAP